MSGIRKILLFGICCLGILALPSELQATHIVGGQLNYRCLGNDLYEITLTVRRDCENGADDAPFDDPAIIGIFDIFGSVQVHLGNQGRIEIPFTGEDTITNSLVFDCSAFGTPVCVHEAIYRDTIFMPFNKIGYRLAYQRCCRNTILVNIDDPLETGATYHVSLPVNVLTECNSQPVFNAWPDIYVCVNEELSFDHSATDPDGDQLVYKLCTPSQGATIDDPKPFIPSNPPYPTVVWTPPFGLSNMFGGNPPLSIDPSTGELTGLPDQVGTYLIGICVEEYRNGELLSSVRRDFEYNVRICTDPILMDFAVSGDDCDGDTQASFENLSAGADFYNWFLLSANGDTLHTTDSDEFTFNFPDFGSYTVILEGTRIVDGCVARKIETIVLGNPDVTAEFEVLAESCDSANLVRLNDLSFDPLGSSVPAEWTWTINGVFAGSTSSILYDAGGEQSLDVQLDVVFNSGCEASVRRIVDISDLFPDLDFEFQLLSCVGDLFELSLLSNYTPQNLSVDSLVWIINDQGIISEFSDDPLDISITGDQTSVELIVYFSNGCVESVIKQIDDSILLPEVQIKDNLQQIADCPEPGESFELILSPELIPANAGSAVVGYNWLINGVVYNSEIISLEVFEGDSLDISIEVVFDNGCIADAQKLLEVKLNPVLELEEKAFCEGDDVRLIIEDITGSTVTSYEWLVDGNLVSSDAVLDFILSENGNLVELNVVFSNGCTQSFSRFYSPQDVIPDFDFEVQFDECLDDTTSRIILCDTSFDPLGSSEVIEWIWTIDGVIVGDSSKLEIELLNTDSIEVELFVLYSSGCSGTVVRELVANDLLPSLDFDVELLTCIDSTGFEILLIAKPSPDSLQLNDIKWTILDQGISQMLFGDSAVVQVSGAETEISLSGVFENNCSAESIKTISAEDLLPELLIVSDLDFDPDDCPEEGDSILLSLSSMLDPDNGDFQIISYAWLINSVPYDTETVSLSVMDGDTLDISLEVLLDNGCLLTQTEELVIGFNPENMIEVDSECNGDTIKVSLLDISGLPVEEYIWQLDGQIVSADSMFMFILGDNGNQVDLEIIYESACPQSYSRLFTREDFIPPIDFDLAIDECLGDSALVSIDLDTLPGLSSDSLLINGIEFDSLPVQLTLSLDDTLFIEYYVEYENGCTDFISIMESVRNLLPDPEHEIELEDCVDNGIVISINDITNYNGDFDTEFVINDGDSSYFFQEGIDSVFISGSMFELIQTVMFDNGCTVSDTSKINQSDILPELEDPILDYSIEPLECAGDSGTFVFTDMTEVPECLYITQYEWVINGDTCLGNPVVKTLPLNEIIPFSYTVYFNNGIILTTSGDTITTNDFIDPQDLIEDLPIEIGNRIDDACSDSISLFIVNPDSSVNYQWAFDNNFEDIIGIGTEIDTVAPPDFNNWVYVQTIENFGDCLYGLDSIRIDFEGIDISFDMPFIICAGDTATFAVSNNDTTQNLVYEWKGSDGQLISGGDTNSPVIGIPQDETDDFFLILCTTSDLGCSSVDTVRFNVGSRDTLLPFTYSSDSCGSLTVLFDESPNMIGDNAYWDFGDGNTSNGSVVEHSYSMPGTYLVTLSDSSDVCASEPISLEINLGNLFIDIALDTIEYPIDSLVTVSAETNGNPDDIKWCLEDGTNVGMGNPLIDFNPMNDTITLIAKIEDLFGCMDSDTVVLVPEIDPEECLDSIFISGPPQEAFCPGEEVQLCVEFDDKCDPSDFSFLWNPEDCIISGQGTPKVIVSAEESKTIMVLVTHIESGQDRIYNFDLNISIPNPQITVPELNVDENGTVFVCLGQSLELTIDPEDPDCIYTWSNGMTGNPIVIEPTEPLTLFVECEDQFGCIGASDSLFIDVIPPQCNESDVFIPNAFSPNGDNINDVLFVRSKFIESMELVIVNRWGQVVFTSTDQTIGWDGTFNGNRLGPDAFSYTLSVVCYGGASYVTTGNVSIIL